MKKVYRAIAATGLALVVSGCGNNSTSTPSYNILDERKLCDIKSNGMDNVLATAIKYNKIAKAEGVEFKRLGMTNTQYIDVSVAAIKEGSKKVVLLNKKGKATKDSVSVEYAVHRACKFALGALNLKAEGKNTWRAAVPGDGFKY